MTDGDPFPALIAAGLGPALSAVEALLEDQADDDPQRWRRLGWQGVLEHLRDHVAELEDGDETDADTGHPTAAHVAARALMVLAKTLS